MSNLVRTTITIPDNLFQQVRLLAFSQNTSTSAIIADSLRTRLGIKTVKPGQGVLALIGAANRYSRRKRPYDFNRRKFYEEDLRHRGII